jgi:hypothetical protein
MNYFLHKVLIVALFFFVSWQLNAQTSKHDERQYKETAAELREDIWKWNLPHFSNYTIPEQYRNFSSVVLARHTDLSAGSKRSTRRGATNITSITRQIVKLNDAVAVKQYSEMSYTQLLRMRGYTMATKSSEFIGVRVIKPDGKVIETNTDDVVLTKDERRERSAKLSIPDLQPGDILDCYFAVEFNIEKDLIRSLPFHIELYDDLPVTHYSLHCTIGRKFATEYRFCQSSQDFAVSEDDDGAKVLDVTMDSLMLVPAGTFWISPERQLPNIYLNVVRGNAAPYTSFTRRRPGELFKNQLPEKIVRDEMINLNMAKRAAYSTTTALLGGNGYMMIPGFDLSIKDTLAREAEIAARVYYGFRYNFLCASVLASSKGFEGLTDQSLNASAYAYVLSEYFKRNRLNSEVVLTTSKYGPRMSELMNTGSLHYLCNVHLSHDLLFGATSLYSLPFFVPAILEGTEDAVAVDTKGPSGIMAIGYTERPIKIPASTSNENQRREVFSIQPDPSTDGVRIARTTTLKGHLKSGIQERLLLLEDFYNYERGFYNDTNSIESLLKSKDASGTLGAELKAVLAQAKNKQKDAFLDEAKEWFEEDITDIMNYQIIKPGVRHTDPDFMFGSAFRLNGLMKHAGSNYILEVGKLIGNPMPGTEAQRKRSLDVYLPCANIVRTEMNIRIPEGYEVDGLPELTKTVTNNAGYFRASSTSEGAIVTVTVEKSYNSSYYSAADWPLVMGILDAAVGWKNAKLRLRKKA